MTQYQITTEQSEVSNCGAAMDFVLGANAIARSTPGDTVLNHFQCSMGLYRIGLMTFCITVEVREDVCLNSSEIFQLEEDKGSRREKKKRLGTEGK